ncbi:MAG: lipoprotein insertase outer membrane protein LolB [Legionella sp.]|nr:lipoprotein insertase outer membrane protein LolB [Legionella sp.]
MTMLKRLGFLSLALLTACAQHKASAPLDATQQNLPAQEQVAPGNTSVRPGEQVQVTEQAPGQKATRVSSSTAVPSSFELSGAMAARGPKKAWSASVNWVQRGAGSYQIRLFGPLGSGTILIQKQGSTVTYKDGPKSASSSNGDELLKQQTGVRLPVNNLYYWVRGIPAPGAVQSAQRDASNHIMVLRQAGFTIQYAGYKNVGNMVLPSNIRLQGNGVSIKFVIKRWNV